MTYQITAYCKGRKLTKKAHGVKALHTNLSALRERGYVVADIARHSPVVR